MEELNEIIREHGICNIFWVNLMVLKVDGNISVVLNNYQTHNKKNKKEN